MLVAFLGERPFLCVEAVVWAASRPGINPDINPGINIA